MNEEDRSKHDAAARDLAPERTLRGPDLAGAEQPSAPDHVDYEKTRNPDTELNLDGEDGSLYNDGIDVPEDDETLSGTRGNSPAAIKP